MKKLVTSCKRTWEFSLEVPVAPVGSQFVYIRVSMDAVHLAAAKTPLQDPPASGHLYLIEGTFSDITRYAGTTGPQQTGSSSLLICCASPSAMIASSLTPQAHRTTTGTGQVEPMAGGKSFIMMSYSLAYMNPSSPTLSYARKSANEKVFQ